MNSAAGDLLQSEGARLAAWALAQGGVPYGVHMAALAVRDAALRECSEAPGASAEIERLRDALRYIAGDDVGGYAAHMSPREVARIALAPKQESGDE